MDSIGIEFSLQRNLLNLTQQELKDSTVKWWDKSILFQNYFSSSVRLFYPISTIKNRWYEGYLNDPYKTCFDFQIEYNRIESINYYKSIPLLLHTILLREKEYFLSKCNIIYEKYDSTIINYFSSIDNRSFQDPNNQIILDSIFQKIKRYPGRSLVGLTYEQCACKIILSGDLDYINKYLPYVKIAVAQKELHPKYLAMVFDKVEVLQNKPQIYGTYTIVVNETSELYPIRDLKNVNQLRAEMGLGPLKSINSNLGDFIIESKNKKN